MAKSKNASQHNQSRKVSLTSLYLKLLGPCVDGLGSTVNEDDR